MKLVHILIGLASGFFSGLVGVGGGVIMIPMMTGVLKMSQHQAHGTSLVGITFTGIAGALTYSLHGSVDLLSSLLLASTAIITAGIGARYANTLPEWKLKRFFGGFIILVTFVFLLKPYMTQIVVFSAFWPRVIVLLITGIFTGFLSGMMGVGGGSIMVPAMVLLAGFTQHNAQGISLLTMFPVASSGSFTHWRLGNVHTKILPGLVAGIVAGSYAGASLAHFLPETVLRTIFAAVSFYLGLKHLRTPRPESQKEQ